MSKPALFGLLFFWLIIITFVVNSVVAYDDSSNLAINNPMISATASADDSVVEQSTSLMSTYWNALTFSIVGLPSIFNLFFQVPTAIIAYMLIEFVIDIIPF